MLTTKIPTTHRAGAGNLAPVVVALAAKAVRAKREHDGFPLAQVLEADAAFIVFVVASTVAAVGDVSNAAFKSTSRSTISVTCDKSCTHATSAALAATPTRSATGRHQNLVDAQEHEDESRGREKIRGAFRAASKHADSPTRSPSCVLRRSSLSDDAEARQHFSDVRLTI